MAKEAAARTTTSTDYFSTRQRDDLRWVYILDGVESQMSFPTAGDAERSALAALKAAQPKRDGWQQLMVWAVAAVPVLYVLFFIARWLGLA